MIAGAVRNGATRTSTCNLLELPMRTLQRWERDGVIDRRKGSVKKIPRKLSCEERELVISTCCSSEYKDLTPHQIISLLAEKGIYIASERTFYRILRDENKLHHRSDTKIKKRHNKPPERIATAESVKIVFAM